MLEKRNEHIGVYYGGEYTYYDIIDYDICCTCKHLCYNTKEQRVECWNKECKTFTNERID